VEALHHAVLAHPGDVVGRLHLGAGGAAEAELSRDVRMLHLPPAAVGLL
jgi:hypothetical protein